MNEALVSIIIPTYYRNESLTDAIECSLRQTHDRTEVIVVDDSGEAHARPVVEEYEEDSLQYIPHEENQGGNPARNTGYEAARGDYIQFLDDDDEIFPSKIEKQVSVIESSPDVGVAYGGIVDRDGARRLPRPSEQGRSLELALQFFWPTTITSSLLISDEVLSSVYPLQNRSAADDIGMKIELAKRTQFDYVDEVLTRIGDSTDSRSGGMEYVSELEAILDEYQREYDEFPAVVRRNALSDTYRTKARVLLDERIWSASAVYYYLLALTNKREFDPILILSILASLFGRPGIIISRRIYKRAVSS
ncbi:glycosyltransferase family 2 protein [Haloterrigena salinisoli]|uniref:glycosyltransferase family 2 protein n=1 Tax=Haloterrigena salinisoli TaxID=3132747 RepID=UPI0030D2CB83